MKAYVLYGINDFKLEEVSKPVIKSDEVLIKVMAAGICGSDIPRAFKTGAHRHPLVIGHEFSGQVLECGENTDKKWIGKRVGVFPLIPCKMCDPCSSKHYEMCRDYNYLGSRCDGGFAEFVAVPEWNLIELPDSVSYEQAAMLEPMAVAVHAIRRGLNGDKDGQSVAVCGMGTIGLFLTMFLRSIGLKKVYVIGNKEFQRHKAIEFGIKPEDYCDINIMNPSEWLSLKTEGRGVDIFFECVGKNETVSQAIDNTAPSGRVILVGNPYSDVYLDKNTYWKVLRNQISVTGTWNSSFTKDDTDDWHYVIDALVSGKIQPEKIVSHRFKLDDLMRGFEIMRNKEDEYGKIICE